MRRIKQACPALSELRGVAELMQLPDMRMLDKLTAQRADRGPLEDSQRTCRGPAKNSQRLHREPAEDSPRARKGPGEADRPT